jgi:hypothetical protein
MRSGQRSGRGREARERERERERERKRREGLTVDHNPLVSLSVSGDSIDIYDQQP